VQFFQNVEVAVLANRALDHNPLLVTLNTRVKGVGKIIHPFQFENR
jgi:hypothetical protein